jgi:hypothetical protein
MSGVYNAALTKFLDADVDWSANNIKAVLVTSSYTFSASHTSLADITAGWRIATSGNLASKTSTSGVADAADITFSSVSAATLDAVVIYYDTGTENTSTLLCYLDGGDFPKTISAVSDVTIQWNASGIFSI